MSYIDRERLYKDVQAQKEYVLSLYDGSCDCIETKRAERTCMAAAFVGVLAAIDNQPSADAEPIRHGRWIERRGELHPLEMDGVCSICGHTTSFYRFHNYCPNCGAKMDLDEAKE